MTSTPVMLLTGLELSVQQVRLAHRAEMEVSARYRHATSFGPVMDNQAEANAVLPLLHLNGYKISNPTIYGTIPS